MRPFLSDYDFKSWALGDVFRISVATVYDVLTETLEVAEEQREKAAL